MEIGAGLMQKAEDFVFGERDAVVAAAKNAAGTEQAAEVGGNGHRVVFSDVPGAQVGPLAQGRAPKAS